MNLNQCFQDFLENLTGRSKMTRRNYRSRLRLFLQEHGEKSPQDITQADVNRWHDVIESRGYREATKAGYRQALKAFFNYCRRAGLIDVSPARHIKVGSWISKRPKLPPEADVQRAAAVARTWLQSNDPVQIRDGLIFLLSMGSGPRIGEIRELRKSEVEDALRRGPDAHGIYRATSYGKTKEVVIRFGQTVADGFRRWLAVRAQEARVDCCFVGTKPTKAKGDPEYRYRPLNRAAATKSYKRVAKAAGIEKPILSHALRHRLGHRTTKEHGPKVAAMILNHKDSHTAATAIAFYHHPDEDDVARAVSDADPGYSSREVEEMARLFGLK